MEKSEREALLKFFENEREKLGREEHRKFVEDTLKWLARMKKK